MDAATRWLREGPAESGDAPLLLLEDSLATVGGPAILLQVIVELARCIAQGRAHAQALALVALDRAPSRYHSLCAELGPAQLSVLDCFTDPYGWLRQGLAPDGGSAGASSLNGILRRPDGLRELLQHLPGGQHVPGAGAPPRWCIVVDSLSRLLDSFGAQAVCQWLHRLRGGAGGASCVLCALNADLHAPAVLAALRSIASGRLELQPLSDLERALGAGAPGAPPSCTPRSTRAGSPAPGSASAEAKAEPHGRVALRLKRRAGRVRAEAQLYWVAAAEGGPGSDGVAAVHFWDAPTALPTPQVLAESAVAAAASEAPSTAGGSAATGASATRESGTAGLALQMEGGMRLSLTLEEEEARRRVQLPYEHRGEGTLYQTGDFRDYLPPEAGGHGAGASAGSGGGRRLGHILYVRDSGSEHDSDEDPDDDLDL